MQIKLPPHKRGLDRADVLELPELQWYRESDEGDYQFYTHDMLEERNIVDGVIFCIEEHVRRSSLLETWATY